MADDATRSDEELAAQAQTGDKHAFESLIRRHKGPLYRFVRRYIGDDDDAYDIVQDVFVSAWMSLGRYDQRKTFLTWLRAIALNKCRDFGRRQAARRRFLGLFASEAPQLIADQQSELDEHNTVEVERLRLLDQAIVGLPSFYKEPLLLTLVSGLSQQETAAQLNTTTKAIEMRIRRAKMKLHEAISLTPKKK